MSLTSYVSVLLLLGAVLLFWRAGRATWLTWIFAGVAVLSSWLLVAWLTADHFTGEGINAATLYHVHYGFEGAGFKEYVLPLGLAAAGILVVPVILVVLGVRRRRDSHNKGSLVGASVLAVASLSTNPGATDLATLVREPPLQTVEFLRHYRTPAITPIASEHPNFVFIFAESLERTYFDEKLFPGLITELRLLEAKATSFTNIHSLQGTGFTMGGLVAALCGIPLFTPAHPNSMSGMDAFLPGATGLSDLLHEQGYYLSFYGGGHREFAGKGKFFETHKFDEVIGFSDLHLKICDLNYVSNWGVYDDSLLDLAFARFTELSAQNRPFGLFILTLDTHSPNGHVSKSVASMPYQDGSNPMLNSVKASDHLIAQFVRRLQASPHGRNTVIVVASDHIAMPNAASELLNRGERRNLLMVLDPRNPSGEQVSRLGSTFDVATTLLPFLGFKGSIGLGRDLRDPNISDADIAEIHNPDTLLSWRSEFERFWEFPRFDETILFEAEPPRIVIDGRRFHAPVLVQLDERNRTTLRFELDSTWDVRLAQQARTLPEGTPYVFVAPRADVETAFPVAAAAFADSPWLMLVGKAGVGEQALPLASGGKVTRAEVERILARWR